MNFITVVSQHNKGQCQSNEDYGDNEDNKTYLPLRCINCCAHSAGAVEVAFLHNKEVTSLPNPHGAAVAQSADAIFPKSVPSSPQRIARCLSSMKAGAEATHSAVFDPTVPWHRFTTSSVEKCRSLGWDTGCDFNGH